MPNFRGNEDLCKSGKEYLNNLLCKFGPFCLQHSKTFDISHAFLRVTIAELSTLKQVRFFWPTLYILRLRAFTELVLDWVRHHSFAKKCLIDCVLDRKKTISVANQYPALRYCTAGPSFFCKQSI